MEWFILLVPALIAIVVATKYPKETVWWEFVLMFVVCLAALLGAKFLILNGITTDYELKTTYIGRVEHREAYSESYLATVTIGKTTTLQRRTRHHPPTWTVYGRDGSQQSVDEGTYQFLLRRWPGEPSKNGHTFTHHWNGSDDTAEYLTTRRSYENRLQASYSVYNLPDVSEGDISTYGLQPYPSSNGTTVPMILGGAGFDRATAEQQLHRLNARYGSTFNCQVWIVIFRNQSDRAAELQEALWERGNRHDYVLCIGIDDQDRVQWTRAFSWTPSEAIVNYGREIAAIGAPLDLPPVIQKLEEAVKGSWVARDFDEFKAIHVAVPIWGLVIIALVTTLAGLGMMTWAVQNEHHDNP
jgi:hypothetical protein